MNHSFMETEGWIRGTKLSHHIQKEKYLNRISTYDLNPNNCSYCNKSLSYKKRNNKFCNNTCAALSQGKGRTHTSDTINKIKIGVRKYNQLNQIKIDNIKYNKSKLFCRIYYYKCILCGKLFISKYGDGRKTCSRKCYKQLFSNTAIKNSKFRGNKNKHARWYLSPIAGKVWLESSWEQILAEDFDKNKLQWTRPRNPFIWIDQSGKRKRYYPDFYLTDHDMYIDPKNPYLAKSDEFKINYIRDTYKINLLIITEEINLTYKYIKEASVRDRTPISRLQV